MARTVAGLPGGLRLTDHISLGVIAKTFPMARVASGQYRRQHDGRGRSAASYPNSSLFPPLDQAAFHQAALDEILEDPAVSSRGRRNPRGVKRKMSNYPIRTRQRPTAHLMNIERCVKILK